MDEQAVKTLEEALRRIFGENMQSGRFLDVTKIPFICKDIEGIRESIVALNEKVDTHLVTHDQFWPVKTLVYSFVAIMLGGMVLTLSTLVLK